jgi:tripartite-type tricarboxylate transporter receptor subunit TctC
MNTLARLLLLCLALPSLAVAQADYPSKPVRIIVPFATGGLTDVLARLSGASLARRFNQPFVTENRPGGNTQIGIDAVAKSPKDGYTLLVTASNIVNEEVFNKNWTVRLDRDIAPISIFAGGGLVLIGSTNIPVTNLRELVAYSKANPGKLNQAQASSINSDIAILRHRLGMGPTVDVVYKGGPLSVQAIVAGESHFYGASIVDVVELDKAGKVRALVYTGRERHPLMPHVPVVAETGLGVNDYDGGYWFLFAAPAGTPPEIVTKLNEAVRAMVKEPEMIQRVTATATELYSPTVPETLARIAQDFKRRQAALAAGVIRQHE